MSSAGPAITIPNDLEACQALIEQLAGTIDYQANRIDDLDREKQEWKLAYTALLHRASATGVSPS